ncbi:uncharacterized protein LOC116514518 isoform X2 [Thamnophis elegans]|uniref:uncharacterized protein LOC116514518 isoform X2 n=1 Tax=Thamnophis elegans TaxID=35005 RepID=UPI0013786DE2|nr:uncharacterized protein LOC116514518 isoform X2 [Thamnophis elegans]
MGRCSLLTYRDQMEDKTEAQDIMKPQMIVQTKTEKLEGDLKRVRDQSYVKISSEESGQLEKLRRETERLSCKAQKEAVEKELLRENNDLKEELYREEQLRMGRCTLLIYRDQMEHKTEAQNKMKPQMVEYQLNQKWLKASVDKIKKSKEPGPDILRWLQKSFKLLKEDSSERSKHILPEWLKASATNLPEECAEASRVDMNGWLEASINHLQEKRPETCELDVEGWLEASIIGIQHLQKFK